MHKLENGSVCFDFFDRVRRSCSKSDCRHWIDYEEDLNCTLVSVDKNGSMSLREVADRLGVSFVRVKQIEDKALKKISHFFEKESI